MYIFRKTLNGVEIATVTSDKLLIITPQDALDVLGECVFNGVYHIIVYADQITPKFFDLKTGIAGEILQKFSTYGVKLGIVGDFLNIKSASLRSFIVESNKYGRVIFVETIEMAEDKFTNK